MPIYEYQCLACGHIEDFIQKFSDPPETLCPHCGKESLKKNVTAPSFQLSGSGWYATDYKDKPAPAKTENATKDSGKATDEKKSDTTSSEPKTPETKPAPVVEKPKKE